ncbi:hypothetical protein Clacol_001357 [Clathrus columnatus]|uniref:Long chronological lifespan protein 2 n=1 Tax=Clathrus columnatus TaxID=1419009 RepID=A0AAV4ZY40_9AGAM|nr:hypothetical protein Clacol_001357 [Clathrus columnatus]
MLLNLLVLPLVSAQFGFFDQMFGGGHVRQQQPSGNQWAMQSEVVSCSNYLCPKTLDCVQSPALCPCPFPEDIRCVIPDVQDKDAATIICVRGDSECKEVQKLAGLP